ncbi:hypothetical protein O6P37_02080 [Mycobacterium sp. CPCC 205372]|uniref:NACHT domain-containing protein n=1 Tax=Mycobacterium hippophais TaxID=3016340 RepID=A0ABT4PM63_9MYCO|nr:hypothetical protein [Mycobacterium hippophais]MCZ8377643.1 hypothetical protein [Mycobacterium hippophais]
MTRATNSRSSAGGSRAASGIGFQAEVFAWWATHAVAASRIDLGIEASATVTSVGSETALGLDDVAVFLSTGGFILVQAKSGMRRLATNASDVRQAVDQVVLVYRHGIPTVNRRPIDASKDRLVIATDHTSSRSFTTLGRICARLRAHPSDLSLESAAGSDAELSALKIFMKIIRSSWKTAAGTNPTDEEVRSLLRVVEVERYDFAEFGADRRRADAMLHEATEHDAFDRLSSEGLRCARTRSWRSREDLRKIVGLPSSQLSDGDRIDDRLTFLRQLSETRRDVRLQVFELDESLLARFFDRIEVVHVPDGGVAVLLGDFGSGKSEIAETWHRQAIDDRCQSDDAPFPVWFSARELVDQSLERAVERQIGKFWHRGLGVSIAIDGVDETDPSSAQSLLDAARIFARARTNVRVLLTARPGIVTPTPAEEITAPLLAQDEALSLVELAGGKPQQTWHWTADMRATMTRPFFALAAGTMLARSHAPSGQADLIRDLVENALAKGIERSAVTSSETRTVLQNAAVNITRNNRDGLSFSDRLIAAASRLVTDGPEHSIIFSLPIFQHWFAAQAILQDGLIAAEVVSDAHNFNRWRWAAAVAVLSAPSVEVTDDLLDRWVTGNPGAASWIVKEAFSGQSGWRSEEWETLDPKTSGPRLLRSLRTWTDALGPLADGVLPSAFVRGPATLGVLVSGHRIHVSVSTSMPPVDQVTEVPHGAHPLIRNAGSDWQPWFSGAPPRGESWPWVMVRERIAKATRRKLSIDPFLGSTEGVWVQERRYDLARRLLGRSSLLHNDLPAPEIRMRAEELVKLLATDRNARFTIDGTTEYSVAELIDLISWIDSTAPERLLWHLPREDVLQPVGHWIWDFYSPQRLMEFESEVYGRACEAYDEALTHSFTRLDWSMPGATFAPFGVVLELRDGGDDQIGRIPTITAMRVPMALMDDVATVGSGATWSVGGRAVITHAGEGPEPNIQRHLATLDRIHSWAVNRQREPIADLTFVTTGADDMSNSRPASSVAAGWLWEDLKNIGLGDGFSPELV